MATLHTRFQEIHREVAAVLKLSRSSPSKPDKSASVRAALARCCQNPYPHCLVSPLLFFFCSLEDCLGLGGWRMEGVVT